jgi:SAM-dependent methyltransferase
MVAPLDPALARAYGGAADAWAVGPARIYDVLADELVACSPVSLAGRLVADVGAGRGAAGRAAARVGAHTIALDLAEPMLSAVPAGRRPPGAVADARALPLASASVGGVVAAFSYNHVTDPVCALAEAARVTRPGGVVLASAYADDDDHPVKEAVEAAARVVGWQPDPWYDDLRRDAVPLLATVDRTEAVAAAAGLATFTVVRVERPFPDLGPAELVEWRMGMASMAPFLERLDPAARAAMATDARRRLGDAPVLVRRMIVLAAVL